MPNLVGTGLNQVSTNSMLGGLAYQDPEHASIKDLDLKNLSQINSEIADTAVDVFVYDTSKDSDGGAWRKRTQHTSWYNETLGTVRRGTRKEFPAVAVIVAETNTLTIYDGDDPDLPMWMKWTKTTMLRGDAPRALAAKNGIIAITNASTYGGLVKIYFVSDTARSYRALSSNNNSEGYWLSDIAGRDNYSSNNYSNNNGGNTLPAIVAENTTDVAMTVLPNAPIDDATGLPIPTIAVATNGGLSVIKDDGNVFDDTTSAGVSSAGIEGCAFSGTKVVYYRGGASGNKSYVQDASGISADFTGQRMYRVSPYGETNEVTDVCHGLADIDEVEGSDDNLILGAEEGIAIINEDVTTPTRGLVAKIASDYNTGWMPGKVKGAFLSDTDTTNVSPSSNLVSNGDFADTNLSNYFTLVNSDANGGSEANSAPYVNGSNQVVMGNSAQLKTSYNLVAGRVYKLSYDCVNKSISAQRLGIYVPSGASLNFDDSITAGGTNTYYYTATSTGSTLIEWRSRGGGWGTYDNFTIIESTEQDRSANNKGLEVYGTVTKSAVATGAELVAYGPFNNSNNFRQPYNSDLNFETNDFSIMFWVYDTGVDQHCTLISRDEREFDISRLASAYGNKLRIYTRNSSESLKAPDSASALPQNKWVCVCVVYTGGNTKKVYLDGELDIAITSSDGEYDIDNTTYGLNIGVRYTGGTKNYSADGMKLALMRISGGAPSAEQIKKMYEDEKHLFVENAACTLYGSSDAVTALAYDEVTDRLHVGTSAGRSDFQGLRRINNTTTAVTTAISAHDEFIIEQ